MATEFIISAELYAALGDELKKNLVQELRRTKAIASGDLIKSIKVDVKETNDGAVVTLEGNEYITYVEKGRKPGRYAPVSDLKKWIKSKGIATDDAKVSSIAFAINNKIKRQGIKPRPIFERAYTNGLPMYDKIITEVLDKDLNKYLEQKLNEL